MGPGLANCPWPPDNTHCSPCIIWLPDDKRVGFPIYGEYDGNANRKRFYAQTFCVDEVIKNLTCKVARFRSTNVPDGDGLFVGIVDLDTLNDPAKLYDPGQWAWAGYLATIPGGTPTEHYYICADMNLTLDTSIYWFFLMVTNGSYEVCGWEMSGFGAQFPEGAQPFWRYNYNEPGDPDGWVQEDNWFRGCVMPYTSGGGALVEGQCQIANPNFPGTAQEGTPYVFSFDVSQLTAFPCGCPETIIYQLFNRDDDTPLGDATGFNLECGYTGVNGLGGSINFTGSGTFHGQLKVGHKTNGSWAVDDAYDFNVTIGNGAECSDYTDTTTCESHGCWWWNNSCHTDQPTQCAQLTDQSDCERWGCYWCNGQCQNTPCDGEGATLQKAETASRCAGWRNYDPSDLFEQSDIVYCYAEITSNKGDLYGEVLTYKWYHQGTLLMQKGWTVPDHWSGVWWCIGAVPGPGTGYIEFYHQGNYIGQSNEYTVAGAQNIVANIVEEQSSFYTGPFTPGETNVRIADVVVKNTGDTGGNLWYALYENPGTAQENLLVSNYQHVEPSYNWPFGINRNIPTTAGLWPLGLKVWGDSEAEPGWGTMGTRLINAQVGL